MASNLSYFAGALLLLLVLCRLSAVSAVHRAEMDSMLAALRSNGYSLFSNAIVTSDLSFELVDGGESSFTFFAPTDSSLFALDMVNSASDYTATLRCHVIPQRLSILGLRRLRSGSTLRTLSADHDLRVERRQSIASDVVVSVDGVDVAVPGLFYGRNIAVHGLRGILNCRSHARPNQAVDLPKPPTTAVDPSGLTVSQPPVTVDRTHAPPDREVVLPEPPATAADSSSVSVSQPPVIENRTHAPPIEANLTVGKDSSRSPVSHRLKSRKNSSENRSINRSQSQNRTLAPSPSSDFSDSMDQPSPSASPDGFSPADSPAKEHFPPEISTAPSLSPATEIESPVPEFSENEDPTALPPSPATSQSHRDRKRALLIENSELLKYISVISPGEYLTGATGTVHESLVPSDENSAACPPAHESAQAAFTRGYIYPNQLGTPRFRAH